VENGYLTFHRAPDRHARFATGASHRPVFDPVTKAWIITEPDSCERLLTSRHVRPATYSEDYAALQNSLGLDFSDVLFAISYIPLCLHGEPHRIARRRVAEHLAARKSKLEACMVAAVQSHLRILREPGDVEMMRQVLEPLVISVMEPLTDVVPAAAECRMLSKIFDKSIGPRKRQRINAELGRLRDLISSKLGPDASREAVGLRVALLILGHDALLGTMGESLHSILAANAGRRLDEMRYPEVPPETGVPFTERVAVESFVDEGKQFNVGDRFRIYLQAFAYSGPARERTRIFGVGSHMCLGKSLSLDLWRAVTSYLASIPLRVEVISHALCSDNYVFLCPDHLTLRLRA
jgi:hypothetical protein